jgi:hypothetical protein
MIQSTLMSTQLSIKEKLATTLQRLAVLIIVVRSYSSCATCSKYVKTERNDYSYQSREFLGGPQQVSDRNKSLAHKWL